MGSKVRWSIYLVCAATFVGSCRAPVESPRDPGTPRPSSGAPAVSAGADVDPSTAEMDLATFLHRLVDLDRLPVLEEGVRTAQCSSYDRSSRLDPPTGKILENHANGDAGQYIRIEPSGEAVMAEMEGPGCIWRIWSANPQGRIRFYFDGAPAPDLELDFNALFSGKVAPFVEPFVWQRRLVFGGNNPASDSYLPIPFAKSCKVTADKAHGQYYHFGYSTFPKSYKVKTFTPDLSPREAKALEEVAGILLRCGDDPQPLRDSQGFKSRKVLEPGERWELGPIEGPATICGLFAKVKTPERWGRRKVLLEIWWDGEESPSVQAPIADFFGDAWDEATYKSLPLGIDDGRNYCWWRMPFAKSARIALTNGGAKEAEVTIFGAEYRKGPLPAGAARFHARWRRDQGSSEFDYPFIECTGRGLYLGMSLSVHNIVGGWWGEGDEKVWVDGEKFPSTFGTGSEDFFGDAWGIRYFVNPFHGCPTREEKARQSCYRWQVSDAIPFERSFRMTIENYAALRSDTGRNDYSSVAYWYAAPGSTDFFAEVKPGDCAPQGRKVLGAVEAEASVDAAALPAGISIIGDEDLPSELSGGKAVRISGPKGTAATFSVEAPSEGRYAVEAILAPGLQTSACEVLAAGKPSAEGPGLQKGPNAVEVRLAGEPIAPDRWEAVVDGFFLHPYKNFIRKWYLLGPFEVTEEKGLDDPLGPEAAPFKADAEYAGIGGKVRWRKVEVSSGAVGSEGGYFTCNDYIFLYAYCVVEAPEARRRTVLVGSDDGVKVWINGKMVHRNLAMRALSPDQDRFEADLVKGRNEILLKVQQGGGPWGFALRFDDPEEAIRAVTPQ